MSVVRRAGAIFCFIMIIVMILIRQFAVPKNDQSGSNTAVHQTVEIVNQNDPWRG